MVNKWIINQDRDEIIKLECCKDLQVRPVKMNSIVVGLNIYYNDTLLGTFDSFIEVLIEYKNILYMEEEFYIVTGYSNWL